MDASILELLGQTASLVGVVTLAVTLVGAMFTNIKPDRSTGALYGVLAVAAASSTAVAAGASGMFGDHIQQISQLVIVAFFALAAATGVYGQAVKAEEKRAVAHHVQMTAGDGTPLNPTVEG